MEKILSVIVPSYNMEELLENNLQSLLIANNRHRLEVIIVNDGSKDGTLAIAQDFQKRYPEIYTIIDKENGNYGSCINAGLKAAKGKYVKIMDADDYYDTKNFESFIDCIEHIDADVIINDYKKLYIGGKEEKFEYSFPTMETLKIADIYTENSFSSLLLPAITYRTSILLKMGYSQTEGISYTDMEWCFSPMTQMETLFYFNRPVYMYVMGREGQTMDPNIYRKRLPQLFKCLESLMHHANSLTLLPWAKRFTNEQLGKHATAIYRYFLIEHQNEPRNLLIEFDNLLQKMNPFVYSVCGSEDYRKKIPYKYVEKWRTDRQINIPFSIRLKEMVYDILGSIHYYILKLFNPNLKR